MKTILIIILIILLICCYFNIYESFTEIQPFKVNYINNKIKPTVLNEGIYFNKKERKIPNDILNNINSIISFEIDPTYFALISLNHSEPQIYRGIHFIQDYNLFKQVTKIEIVKNIAKLF